MKTDTTKRLENLLACSFDYRKDFYVFECTIGWSGHEIVDCIKYTNDRKIYCYEIKQSKADFHSKNALTFIGNYNYFVMPYALYEQVKDEIPLDVGVYVAVEDVRPASRETGRGTEYYAEYIDGLSKLHCIKSAHRRELRADKEIILSSMLRSMQNKGMNAQIINETREETRHSTAKIILQEISEAYRQEAASGEQVVSEKIKHLAWRYGVEVKL